MKHTLLLCLIFIPLVSHSQAMSQKEFQYLEEFYTDLHLNPELSFHEVGTAAKMAAELKSLGFKVTEKVGGHGVVGVFKNGKGPTVLVRADMDGLPVVEETGLSYASSTKAVDDQGKKVGVMHACGHDMHMTVWAGTARVLVRKKDRWQGTLVFIAEPAEERSGGALAMLKDGLYTRFPKPDFALGLHVNASLASGKVAYTSGFALANVDMMDITVYGRGGHGAYPHTTIDPVVLSARIVMALQTLVSREVAPIEPAVVTVGSIHGGSKGNVIPNEVKLELTLRSYSDEVRTQLIEGIKRTCKGIASSAGLESNQFPSISLRDESTPALYNDPVLSDRLDKSMSSAIGKENVVVVKPAMGGEDFGQFGRTSDKIPIMFYWLGTIAPEKILKYKQNNNKLPSLHSSKYFPEKESIKTGVDTMTSNVMELLKKH